MANRVSGKPDYQHLSLFQPGLMPGFFFGSTQNIQVDETVMPPHKGLNQNYETTSIRHLEPNETFFSFAVIVSQADWIASPSG